MYWEVKYLAQGYTVCNRAEIQTQTWVLNIKLYSLPGTLYTGSYSRDIN